MAPEGEGPCDHVSAPRPHPCLAQPLILHGSSEHSLWSTRNADSGVVQKSQDDLQNLLSWILFFNGSKNCFFLSHLHLQSTFMHEWGRGQDTWPSKQLCTDWTPLAEKARALQLHISAEVWWLLVGLLLDTALLHWSVSLANAKPSQLTELQKRFYVGSGNIPALFLYVCISFLWSFAFPCEILNDYLSF